MRDIQSVRKQDKAHRAPKCKVSVSFESCVDVSSGSFVAGARRRRFGSPSFRIRIPVARATRQSRSAEVAQC